MEVRSSLGNLNAHRKQPFYTNSLLAPQDLINLSQPLLTLRKNNTLAYQGKQFQSLYIVQCGTLKQTIRYNDKTEQLSQFFFPGDIIGLDAIGEGNYCGTITAIETSGLYHIPFRLIEESPISHSIHIQLLRCLSRAMCFEHSHMWQMISQPSDVRLACFFITISCKFSAQGYSPYCFKLAMSRKEIADYLSMANETLSRLVSRFQQQGILSAHGHEYCILSSIDLAAIAKRKI